MSPRSTVIATSPSFIPPICTLLVALPCQGRPEQPCQVLGRVSVLAYVAHLGGTGGAGSGRTLRWANFAGRATSIGIGWVWALADAEPSRELGRAGPLRLPLPRPAAGE
jgi:hypothetical protein